MFKNIKYKIFGLLTILILFTCMIPIASAEEQYEGCVDEILNTKTLPELLSLNGQPIPEDLQKFHAYIVNNYNLTGKDKKFSVNEFWSLIKLMQNKTRDPEQFEFFMAYAIHPNEIYYNEHLNDTPTYLVKRIPYYKSIIDSWIGADDGQEGILTHYFSLDLPGRAAYVNTETADAGTVSRLFEEGSPDEVMYMINQSVGSLDALNDNDLCNPEYSSDYWTYHPFQAKKAGKKMQSDADTFFKKVVQAHDEYDLDPSNEDFNMPTFPNLQEGIWNESMYVNANVEDLTKTKDSYTQSLSSLTETRSGYVESSIALAATAVGLPIIGGVLIAIGGSSLIVTCGISSVVIGVGVLLIIVGAIMAVITPAVAGQINTIDNVIKIYDQSIDLISGFILDIQNGYRTHDE